jgi:uncharacterized membrane protein YeaQ/YmgE (transglycosylase-associated protein family)
MHALLAAFGAIFGLWLVFNLIGALIVGAIARAVFPAKDKVGWPTTIALGFFGGIVGKVMFALLRWPTRFGMGFVASVTGAFLLLFVHHLLVSRRSDPTA